MSDVRLSNASPTVERVDPRPQDSARPSVCRALFGRPDTESNRAFLTNCIANDVQHFMERYNFDPVADRPLSPGNYQWEEDRDAPEFYRRGPHLRGEARGTWRKRPSGNPDPCSSDAKKSLTEREDDDSPPGAAGCSVSAAAEESADGPGQEESDSSQNSLLEDERLHKH
ncbi:cyclin-dependent kinase inhibitor 1Ba [Synchiropus picturatus]